MKAITTEFQALFLYLHERLKKTTDGLPICYSVREPDVYSHALPNDGDRL